MQKVMNRYLYILIINLGIFNSCAINGNLGGLYSNYDKTKAKNPNLIIKPQTLAVCDLKYTDTPQVYMINGSTLRQCLKNFDAVILYRWSPRCKGEFCYSLNALQKECNNKNIELFIIAEYYDLELMTLTYNLKRPVLGIDTEYYKTNLTKKYWPKFLYDVTSHEQIEERFIYLQKGVVMKSFDSLDELKKTTVSSMP